MQRLTGEIPKVYKIVKAVDELFTKSHNTDAGGHLTRLVGDWSITDKRKYFFTQQIVNFWNLLPQETVEADSISRFKNGLDKFVDNKSIIGY